MARINQVIREVTRLEFWRYEKPQDRLPFSVILNCKTILL